jgi:hypothetical protein
VNTTRLRTALGVALIGALAAFGLAFPVAERSPAWLSVPWLVPVLLVVVALGLLVAAWPVRQYARGQRRWTDPLRAAGIFAFAKACSLVASGLTGVYLGIGLFGLTRWEVAAYHGRVLWDGLAAVGALVLAVAGLVAERWCRLPPPPQTPPAPQAPPAAGR